jgi:phosphatidate cytidylyltransferase
MFRQRLLMTLILIPAVIALIFYAPSLVFAGFLLCLLIGMSHEWQQFFQLASGNEAWFKTLLIAFGAILVFLGFVFFLYLDLAFWLFALVVITAYPKFKQCWAHAGFIAANAWILLGVSLAILYQWQGNEDGRIQLLAVMALVWAADIGAYLVGRKWGKHKMIPLVSPGKSWEGLIGGLFSVGMVACFEIYFIDPFSPIQWFVVSLVTGFFSVFGDLWISLLKRQVGLKDTGSIIPGHGGLLDRLDSLLAAIPIFYFGIVVLGDLTT